MGSMLLGAWFPVGQELLAFVRGIVSQEGPLPDELSGEIFFPGIALTLKIAMVSSLVAGFLGTLLALGIAVSCQYLRGFSIILAAPLFMPHVVVAQMLVVFLGQSGLLNRFLRQGLLIFGIETTLDDFPSYLFDSYGWSVVAGLVYKEIPFIATLMLPSIFAIFHRFGPMARNLGVSWWRFLADVLAPAVWPAAAVGILMCAAYGLVSYEIPLMLGRTFPKVVSAQAVEWYLSPLEKGHALAFALGSTLVVCGLFFGYLFLRSFRQYRQFLATYRKSLVSTEILFERDDGGWQLVRLCLGTLLLSFLLPLFPLGVWSMASAWPWPFLLPQRIDFSFWKAGFELDPSFLRASLGSLAVAGVTTICSVFLVVPLAHWLARPFLGRFAAFFEWIPLAPLFIPGFITAMGMSRLFLCFQGDLGAFFGTVITHIVAFSPYLTFNLASALLTQGHLEEEAAATLGATPWQVYRKITVPKFLPALGWGSLFVFIASFGDVVLSQMTLGYGLPTLGMMLMPLMGGGERSLSAVGSLVMVGFPMIVLAGVFFAARGVRILFRNFSQKIMIF